MHLDLTSQFRSLTDDELLERIQRGLADEAVAVARAETTRRGLGWPAPANPTGGEAHYAGDMVIVARGLEPIDAHVLCGLLQSEGVWAQPADVHTIQTNMLYAVALGGAKVRVPATQLADAQRIITAYKKGEFALDDDSDPSAAP